MWVLPADLAQLRVTLPEGVLLVPHHYTALDRERLLWLLRAAMPECRQLAVEAASLDALIERKVTWPGGIVLVHGFAADTEVDALRGRVAPLGARHALVQLPQPQLTGTGWMEPTLKVPLLRAIERAWRDPEHPLRGVGIAEMPVREAAKYTDEPVELLAIVQEALAHRLAHVSVGMGALDWARSVDHALAQRLRARMPEGLPAEAVAFAANAGRFASVSGKVIDHLSGPGLVIVTSVGPRPIPLLTALSRPLVRAYAVPGARVGHDAGEMRARELFHIANEAVMLTVGTPGPIGQFPPERLTKLMDPSVWLRADDRQLHLILDVGHRGSDLAATILRLRLDPSDREARGLALYLACLDGAGERSTASLRADLADLEDMQLDAPWFKRALKVLRFISACRLFIERADAKDLATAVQAILPLTGANDLTEANGRDLWDEGIPGLLTLWHLLVPDPPIEQVDGQAAQLSAIGHGQAPDKEGPLPRGWANAESGPAVIECWPLMWHGRFALVVGRAPRIGTQGPIGKKRLTLEDLHGDLVVGVAALAVGDLDLATERARRMLDLATRHEIPVLRAFAREILAAVHELRGEYDEAAQLLLRARARYLALEDTPRIAGVEKRLTRMGIAFEPPPPKPRARKIRR